MKDQYIQVFTTTDKKQIAEKIAKELIKKKLAGCVQIFAIESIYEWKGKIENAKEFLCIIKTKKSVYEEVEKAIKELHNYKIPEIISLAIIDGNKEYLNWLNKQVKRK